MEHFLPLKWSDTTAQLHTNSDQISNAYGLPLPRVLKLMRILIQRSPSLRLMLVNDWNLVERCLTYLRAHPLPRKLGILLQLESLRCLTVCLEAPQPPIKAVEVIK